MNASRPACKKGVLSTPDSTGIFSAANSSTLPQKSHQTPKKKLAAAAKEYQSAKVVTDPLLKSLDIEMSSSQETASTDNAVEQSQAEILDIDNVFTKYNQTDSIGKRIKSEAVVLHNKYLEREVATTEKFVMDMGLSSILDLSHPEDNLQGYLFSEEDLNDYFYGRFKLQETSHMVATHIDSVSSLALKKGLFIALKYLSKIQSLESTEEVLSNYLDIYRHVLVVLGDEKHLLNAIVTNNKSVSEQDVNGIWLPIIKRLSNVRQLIRIKQGETVNSFTSKRKQAAYPDHEKVRGFKIDIRMLLDYENYEFDLCAGEVAINSKES